METIFKVGDRVCCYQKGWGTIIFIEDGITAYPVGVQFDSGYHENFTGEGHYYRDDLGPSLSFTEYNLVTGGFSQERPLPNIEVDTLVYVKESGGEWRMRYFSHWYERKLRAFDGQNTSKTASSRATTAWLEYSLTNPLEQ